jgi:hypothetical protein
MDGYIYVGSVYRDGMVHFLNSTWESDGQFEVKTRTMRGDACGCS